MTDRKKPLYDLLAGELADDWQPSPIPTNQLPYKERQQIKNGPDPDFIEEKLAEAQRGRKRTTIVAGVAFALIILLPVAPSLAAESNAALLIGALWTGVPLGATALALTRHMHWRKRAMIYRAFRLMDAEKQPAVP